MLKRFAAPYKGYVIGSVFLNILSAVFNIFSFTLLIPILNILRIECFPASDTYAVTEPGKRPICPEIPDFDTPIGLDDGICQGVLPYGLAAHLLLDENPDVAAYFNQRYEQLLAEYRAGIPAAAEDIQDLYGGIEYGCFASW